jgi:hypothetical protein
MTQEQARSNTTPLSFDEALGNASRLLINAETITDHSLMERLEHLADTWVGIANLIHDREKT